MGKSLFWKGILYGALAGGALTMFDRNTRQTVMASCKKSSSNVGFYLKHPNKAISQVKEVTNKVKSTVEQVSADVSFITEKVEELKEGTPQVAELFEQTKIAFIEDEQEGSSKEERLSAQNIGQTNI